LRIPPFPAASSPSQTEMRQTYTLFYRSKHGKGRTPVSGDRTLADSRPTLFDEAKREMINSKKRLSGQILALMHHHFDAILWPLGRFSVDPSAERWQSG
jgi:hypothetical protein